MYFSEVPLTLIIYVKQTKYLLCKISRSGFTNLNGGYLWRGNFERKQGELIFTVLLMFKYLF